MSCNIEIREYTPEDLNQMVEIWNEVVEEGIGMSGSGVGKSIF